MSKPKIILFSRQLSNCPCYNTTFNADFETQTVASGKDFWRGICQEKADAAIVCLCSAVNEKDDVLFRLLPLSGPVPVLTCTRNLTPDFIQMARQQGVNRFLRCTMKREEIRDTVFKAIRHGGLWEWLETYYQEGLDFSPHIRRLIEEIMHTLPRRIQESEMAQRLGISRSWLQKLCRRAFGTSFTGIMRRIRVHQALCLMHLTAMDNTEIAMYLNYSEESSLARDFHKELDYSPTTARQLLSRHSPKELLLSNKSSR